MSGKPNAGPHKPDEKYDVGPVTGFPEDVVIMTDVVLPRDGRISMQTAEAVKKASAAYREGMPKRVLRKGTGVRAR